MKRRRDGVILMVLWYANVSALIPDSSIRRTNFKTTSRDSDLARKSTRCFARVWTAPNVPARREIETSPRTTQGKTKVASVQSRIKQRKLSKAKRKESEEFQWLNWVYNQWRDASPGEISEEVLKQMVPAISRWGRRKTMNAAKCAEELLNRIVEENMAGNPHAELTVSLFNAAMDGYAKIGHPEGVHRILRKMEAMSTDHDHLAHLKPDNFSMSILITALTKSRSPDAADKAQGVLNYMEINNLTPNTITYNTVLNALALGTQIDKAVRAEDLVKKMKARHAEGKDCKPDIYSYQSLIHAWSRTTLPGSPQRAEKILRFLDEESEKGDKKLSPNAYCFTTAIYAWARSGERQRARSAYQILNHMTKRYLESQSAKLKPNVKTFTNVLNACARPADESERDDAFEIAQLTFEELSLGNYDKPNFLSFAAFLSVCCSTVAPGDRRDEIVRRTFEQCKEAGQVGKIVLAKLRIAASHALYEELVGDYITSNGTLEIPYRWTRFIRGERNVDAVESDLIVEGREQIPHSSKVRLEAVKKFGGKSGFYSGKAPPRPEAEGISWSKRPLGVDI